jgi:UDPglucose 6-dehydrogenase
MDLYSAELTKYAANAFLATKISFINEIANLCERVGADVNQVRKGIGTDTRIGDKFLYPGIGYGGSCFPKDVKALARTANEQGYKMHILDAVEIVNIAQKSVLVNKIKNHFGCDLRGKNFALWGLSFKPQTDDMREAPSIIIIEALLELGATLTAYDPVAMDEAKHILQDRIIYADNKYEALKGADAVLLVTEWDEFRKPNWRRVREGMRQPVVFDGRNIYNPHELQKLEFTYFGIGTV